MAAGRGGVSGARPSRSGPRAASERLRRLLVMLPWLMEQGEVPLSGLAERFGLREDELVADLELIAMCGLPPFVDELIDVFIDDDVVMVGIPRLFTRPLRITVPEGIALLAAGRAALALPGADPTGPLARALDKLAVALDVDQRGLVVDEQPPESTALLADAAARGERLRIRYWTPSRDEVSERTITPRRVMGVQGHWYVVADDDRSGDRRTFRIDRIEAIEATGESVEVRAPDPADVEPGWFDPRDGGLERVVLRVPGWAAPLVERYPQIGSRPQPDGSLELELLVASEHWLARLLVRLGPEAEVREPDGWRDLGRRRAAAVLARYERGGRTDAATT